MQIAIRAALPDDGPAIRLVHQRAFRGRPAEADLVKALTAAGKAAVSLVATFGDHVAGHILFSPVAPE